MEKIIFYPQKEFRQFEMPANTLRKYAISNRGRLISYKDEMVKGRILNAALADVTKLSILNYTIKKKRTCNISFTDLLPKIF